MRIVLLSYFERSLIILLNAIDVAKWFILNNTDVTSNNLDGNIKLQKLLYYSQAMNLVVYDKRPLFIDGIQAWERGPVIPSVYTNYRYNNLVKETLCDSDIKFGNMDERILKVINLIYGNKTGKQLSELTHEEQPWASLKPEIALRRNPVITKDALFDYYQPLKEIFFSYQSQDIDDFASDHINGNIFTYKKSELKLTDELINKLWTIGDETTDCSYFVYVEDGELVVY